MTANLVNLFTQSYATNTGLLLQQKGTKLQPFVTYGTYTGKQASVVDQFGAVEAQDVTNRFAPMGRVDAPVDRRWVFPSDSDLPQLVDTFDKLRVLENPESALVQNAVYAMGRKRDDVLLAAMFNDAKTGETGATTTSFLAANVVSVDTGGVASSLNVKKLREAKRILMSYEVDFDNDPVYVIVTSKEADALLGEIQITSLDFNERPVLQDGKVARFLGMNFVHCERLTRLAGTDDQGGTSNPIPIFAKSGLHLAVWGELQTAISQREDLRGRPWQAYMMQTIGATRTEEKKVMKVWCH